MYVEILYSNITWGEDLLHLVSGHVSSSFSPISRFWKKLSNISIKFATQIITLLFMLSFMIQLSSMELSDRKAIKALKNTTDTDTFDLINKKLDVIITHNMEKAFVMPTVITIIGVILVTIGFGMIEYLLPRSYLLLNEFTEAKRKIYLARKNIIMVGTILSLFVGILSSILATYITNYFAG